MNIFSGTIRLKKLQRRQSIQEAVEALSRLALVVVVGRVASAAATTTAAPTAAAAAAACEVREPSPLLVRVRPRAVCIAVVSRLPLLRTFLG